MKTSVKKRKLNLSISRVENRKEIKGLVSKNLPAACCCCCCGLSTDDGIN